MVELGGKFSELRLLGAREISGLLRCLGRSRSLGEPRFRVVKLAAKALCLGVSTAAALVHPSELLLELGDASPLLFGRGGRLLEGGLDLGDGCALRLRLRPRLGELLLKLGHGFAQHFNVATQRVRLRASDCGRLELRPRICELCLERAGALQLRLQIFELFLGGLKLLVDALAL